MTSTSFNVGLGSASRNSSKVLKPPGGGSSDIFGTTGHEPEPQQRKTKTNHLTSSIFGGEDAQTPARKPGNDSFYNLFGAEPQSQSRPGTAAKDKFKSNIVLDDVDVDAKKILTFSADGCRTEMENGTPPVLVEPEGVNGVETNNTQRNGVGVHKNGAEDDGEKEEINQATTNGERAEPAVNGSSASSTASTPASAPAPAPAPPASAASRPRVPPGGFSSGLW